MANLATSGRTVSLPREEWTVMFIDLVGSTEFKYKDGAEKVAEIITELFAIIQDNTSAKQLKFTGDGAMAIFKKNEQGALKALEAAERILQRVDSMNLRFNHPRIHIRIGVATGKCYEVSKVGSTELSGKTADLAARLEGEAEVDSILVDLSTREASGYPGHRFTKCDRRLSLRGVPIAPVGEHESFYFFKARRLLRPPKEDHYSKGLLALFADRQSLIRDLSAIRLIHLAKPGSTILVAGRTLKHWKEFGAEISWAVKENDIRFHLVIGSDTLSNSVEIQRQLEKKQIDEIRTDLPESRAYFLDLAAEMVAAGKSKHFQLRETDYLILDGITCAEIVSPGNPEGDAKLITLQDINAASGGNKATFVLACRCNAERNVRKESCMAHGLHKRTHLIFTKAHGKGASSKSVERIVRLHREGSGVRNNAPSQYAAHIKEYFPLIDENRLNEIPPPLCVQMQVSSTCSTNCRMCDHWKTRTVDEELTSEKWKEVFGQVADFKVKSIIFSGGEPLMRPDIAELLESAHGRGLKIGLLTNGTMPHKDEEKRKKVTSAIKDYVEWVAISIDGTPDEDKSIRQPGVQERCERVKELSRDLRGGPQLSATVTLQQKNIRMNLKNVIRFITEDVGIPRVNFKLATGSNRALDTPQDFLLSEEQLKDLEHFLWNSALVENENNNLDYLRRSFAAGIFDVISAAGGAPIGKFYESENLRCHTPFLFSLIDSDGSVYPCCHLYRDNHGADARTPSFRREHHMGDVKVSSFGEIWNGDSYVKERDKLKKIEPKAAFSPCGECTRHCQHNRVLTQIYREFKKDPKALDQLTNENTGNHPVWF